jgi:hypothetical protein
MPKTKQKKKGTTLWHCSIKWARERGGYYVECGSKKPEGPYLGLVSIRMLTARAAARKYIRDNAPSILYQLDDGGNDASEIDEKSKDHRKNETKFLKKCVKRLAHDEAGNVVIVYL